MAGTYREGVASRGAQLKFINEMSAVREEMEESAATGDLDVVLGREVLEVEAITFLPFQHLCTAGTIPRENICGR